MSIKLENISYVYSPGTAYEHHALDTRVRENQP